MRKHRWQYSVSIWSVNNSFELSKDIAIYGIQAPEAMDGNTLNDLQNTTAL
ncbi:hypothetical protein [Fodinibius halophilus]|uniref:Uncharacterized protein n=1 Tax=Fodinibius halophilus TaxID=1736908 RepID=A0A6M1SX20_9BACT|nr:hypothetical protein [Fodinibius halophilus]NGP88086.1 hypothetical protein [Fodinibius halophilus]